MHTLTPHVTMYITGRRARGEITQTTALDYRWTLNGLVESYGDRPLRMFGPAAVDRWLESIAHLAPSTRREYLSRVRCFSQWLVAQRRVRADATAHVPAIRQARRNPRVLTPQEMRALLAVLPDRRAHAVVRLMDSCGLRCCEVARLHVEDYDPTGRVVSVRGKASHERQVPVPLSAAVAVDAYLDEVGTTAGPLIRSGLRPSHGLSPRTLSGYVRGWMRDAGVKVRAHDGRSAHGLRRTGATALADHCSDPRVLQQFLGHERSDTVYRHYVRRVTFDRLREAVDARDAAGA